MVIIITIIITNMKAEEKVEIRNRQMHYKLIY